MISTRQIARALGGEVAGRYTVLAPGPGHSPRDRSLAVRLDPRAPDGFVVFSHCGDNWKQCRDHVRERLGLPPWQPGNEYRRRTVPQQHIAKWDMAVGEAEANDIPQGYTEDETDRINLAQRIWQEAEDPRGTLAEKYLRGHRCLDLPDDLAGTVLRYHAQCPWRNESTGAIEHVPTLVVPFCSIDNNDITGIHRIALNDDGSKRGRRMLGIIRHTAIRLDQINGETLIIGEGVESCMAARQLELRPVWALGSAGAIAFFPLIDGIKMLTILGERDEANARAIDICHRRWRKAGRRVRTAMPEQPFKDFNDVWRAELTERTAS